MKKSTVLLFLFLCGTVSGEAFDSDEVTTFVSPDCSYSQLESLIEGAEYSLYVNVYTFDSPFIAAMLSGAHERGVDVIAIVDAAPVGRISEDEWAVLNNLSGKGIPVYLWAHSNSGFNHAKYIVADNSTVLVTTENFGSSGFPEAGASGNRGWGAIASGPSAAYFADLFFNDTARGERVNFTGESPLAFYREASGYEPRLEPETFHGDFTVETVVAPENAVGAILELIDSANESLYVEQFYVHRYWGSKRQGHTPNPFLEASIDAARRGAEVKLLLDSTWYNVEADDPRSNAQTAAYVNSVAEKEGLNLEARLVDLESATFKKLHAKGVIVDNNTVLVSSVNWNKHSPTKNREAGVIIHGEPAEYFAGVFMADWEPEAHNERDNRTLLLIPLALAAAALYMKRRK